MRRLILSLWFVLSLFPFAAVSGCGNTSRTPLDFGNTSIELPQHVGYALASGSIMVFDADNAQVVGVHNICIEDEYVGDFAIAPNGSLLIPIGQKGLRALNLIRVMDPSTGVVTGEFEVSRGPQRMYGLVGGLAIVEHPYLPSGSTEFACDVIDMDRMALVKTHFFKGIGGDVLNHPAGKYFIGITDVIKYYGGYTLVEFDPLSGDAISIPVTLTTDFEFETAVFSTETRLYALMDPSESPPISSTVRPLAVLEFPSGRQLRTITVPFDVLHMVRVGQKVYVASFLGSTWKGALEVGKGIVSVVDANTDQIVKTLDVSPGPQHMAYSESTGKLYVACVDGKISVIDTATDEVTGTIVCDDPRASEWGFNRIKVAS